MDKHRRRFFWSGKKNKNAIIWLNGQKCIGPKEKEVFGVEALRKQNTILFM
jgi:hypothetical protein